MENKVIQYHVVGSLGEYEDTRHVLIGVFDTKEKAASALNKALQHVSNGKINSPEDIEPFFGNECKRSFDTLMSSCSNYNPYDFKIEEVPLNELVYIVQTFS